MGRIFAVLCSLVVLAAGLALPAATSAASGYTYTIKYNYCTTSDRVIHFKVREQAAGYTPANYLTIDSWPQIYDSGSWHNQKWFLVQRYYRFVPDGTAHHLAAARQWGNAHAITRLVMKLRIWHDNTVLAAWKVHSVSC